jgi:8-oxo-dGTP diphosphatase
MRHTSDGIAVDHLALAILRHEDSVVLVQQQGPLDSQPYWVLPGGLVEAGELIADALIREVQEEAGVQVTAITQLACLIQIDRPEHHAQTVAFAFEVGTWHGTLGCHDPDAEVLAVELVPLAEAISRLGASGGWPGVQAPLLMYLRGDARVGTFWCYREDSDGQHMVARLP